jgi:sugar-phosphatase
MLSFPCDAVLFDMDGTLVNSNAVVERIWRAWALRHGFDPEPILAVAHGRRTSETMHEIAPDLDYENEAEWFDAQEEDDTGGVVEVPGAAALLAQMECWAVVTSAHRKLAEIRLRGAGLPIPAVMVCGDEIRHGKPDPEGYLKAAVTLGVAPGRCVVIEDTPVGIEAGRRAGMQLIAVCTTHSESVFDGVACVRDLTSLRMERGAIVKLA